MSHVDFSSWPADQERAFVVFEERTAASQKKAMTMGVAVALGFFVVMAGIYFGVAPDHRDPAKSMDMSNLTKKGRPTAEATTPAPAPVTTPAAAPATK